MKQYKYNLRHRLLPAGWRFIQMGEVYSSPQIFWYDKNGRDNFEEVNHVGDITCTKDFPAFHNYYQNWGYVKKIE